MIEWSTGRHWFLFGKNAIRAFTVSKFIGKKQALELFVVFTYSMVQSSIRFLNLVIPQWPFFC